MQNLGGTLTFYSSDLSAVSLEFLQKRGCGLPALSPWSDFLVASCITPDHRDLVLFVRSGNDWKETAIGEGINTAFDETAPRISADGRYLFFASDGHPGYGAFDYFFVTISYSKEGTLQFGKAVNFGPQVNTFHSEVYPLQLSHLIDGMIFSAEGKDGLIGKATAGGLPKVQRTYSCRFIAYGDNGAVPQSLTLTPVKGDPRPAQTLVAGEKSPWIRLLTAAEYRVSGSLAGGLTVTDNSAGRDGTDRLSGIERLGFSDGSLAFDLGATDAGGRTALMLSALLGPQAALSNPSWTGIGLSLFDSGQSTASVASLLVSSGLTAQLAGGASHTSFVQWLYKNVVGSAPSADVAAGFVGLLNSGAFTQASLLVLATEHPLNQTNINLVGLAGTGIPYL